MAIVLLRGNDRSVSFRRRLLLTLANDSPLPSHAGQEDCLDATITTKYYTAQVTYCLKVSHFLKYFMEAAHQRHYYHVAYHVEY